MDAILIMVVAFVGYLLAYRLYGRFIGKKIFALTNANKTPAVEMEDGQDYVPTRKGIIFGHHFTSIAGTGPIVGPAIADGRLNRILDDHDWSAVDAFALWPSRQYLPHRVRNLIDHLIANMS